MWGIKAIEAHGSNGHVDLFAYVKSNYANDGELGKPFNVVCRIDLEPRIYAKYWGTIIEIK